MIRERFDRMLAWASRKIVQRAGIGETFVRGGPAVPTYIGATDVTEGAMRVSALSACVRLISGNVAKLPIHVFRLQGEDRKRDRKHPVDRLLNQRPNSWQTAHEFRRMMTAHVALYGNAFAIKLMSGSTIDELIPQHPSNVKVVKDDPFLPPVYEIRMRPGVMNRYPATDILHLRDLSLDGVVGLSRIQQAQQGVALAMAAETYATAYFMNGAEPGVALESDKTLTDEQYKRLSASWKEAHQGPARAHAPTILEGGLKLKQTTTSNKDSQFLELRSFQVEDIARLYGVPPHLIGLTEKQTSWGTGVEQMAIGFLEFNLLDWLVMWETAIKRDCLSGDIDATTYAEHLVDSLLRADLKTRMDAYALAIQNGILSRNEARKKENLPPYDGGDDYLYPANMNVNGDDSELDESEPATFPSDNARHAWLKRMLAAQRAVASREAV